MSLLVKAITEDVIRILGHRAQEMSDTQKRVRCGVYDPDGAFIYRGDYCQIFLPHKRRITKDSTVCVICRGHVRRAKFCGNIAKKLAQHCIDRYPETD